MRRRELATDRGRLLAGGQGGLALAEICEAGLARSPVGVDVWGAVDTLHASNQSLNSGV
jgi:hypothetical protein